MSSGVVIHNITSFSGHFKICDCLLRNTKLACLGIGSWMELEASTFVHPH